MASAIVLVHVLVHRNVPGLTKRGKHAGASTAVVAERSRSCEGATCAEPIVTDTAIPEQTDAYLPDGVIIPPSRQQIHKPMVLA
jgi:hypothetical protein